MIGGGKEDKKFIAKIIRQLKEGKKVIYAVDDKYGTPTYTVDFASAVCLLVKTDWYGLYHAACTGSGNRVDVAREIVRLLKVDDVEVVPVSSNFFQDVFPAPRPRSEMLRNYVLELRGLNIMRPWKEALAEYLARSYHEIGEGVR